MPDFRLIFILSKNIFLKLKYFETFQQKFSRIFFFLLTTQHMSRAELSAWSYIWYACKIFLTQEVKLPLGWMEKPEGQQGAVGGQMRKYNQQFPNRTETREKELVAVQRPINVQYCCPLLQQETGSFLSSGS